jgi:S-adenosylmethionine-diacylglycerol 3-amino-3-carboxypropyl transferase
MSTLQSEAAARVDFSEIRYAQVWEDADILLEGLEIQPGQVCVSIASAGDNAIALLTRDPAQVVALDLNPSQVACLALRVAAYRALTHPELLELMGSRPSTRRATLYARCRRALTSDARAFWDAHGPAIDAGVGSAGRFERYFAIFRKRILPLVHSRRRVLQLPLPRDQAGREAFYQREWDTWRWRLMFRLFFSRVVMGRLGRDPEFFRYVDEPVATRILKRTRHALTVLDPSENPYIHWILTGTHGVALPAALRAEHFDQIRHNLDRLTWRCQPLEDFLQSPDRLRVDRYNLSDIFEYMSLDNYHRLLDALVEAANPGARLAYWNMLAPRRRPESMSTRLEPLDNLARRLHAHDKAFFYNAFVVEEVK